MSENQETSNVTTSTPENQLTMPARRLHPDFDERGHLVNPELAERMGQIREALTNPNGPASDDIVSIDGQTAAQLRESHAITPADSGLTAEETTDAGTAGAATVAVPSPSPHQQERRERRIRLAQEERQKEENDHAARLRMVEAIRNAPAEEQIGDLAATTNPGQRPLALSSSEETPAPSGESNSTEGQSAGGGTHGKATDETSSVAGNSPQDSSVGRNAGQETPGTSELGQAGTSRNPGGRNRGGGGTPSTE